MPDPTVLLEKAAAGDAGAVNRLFDLLYGQLHERARAQRRRWHGNLTMNTTAIVHEAYVRLVDHKDVSWKDRAHFLALASRAMRHVLIDYARRASSEKRGGNNHRTSLEDGERFALPMDGLMVDELMDLEAALVRLDQAHPPAARVVECRFFGGMTVEETAAALDISTPTVKRRWAMARAWLSATIVEEQGEA